MKTISPALRAHLQTRGPFIMADLYAITLAGGTILRWADFDVNVVHPTSGLTYVCTGPVVSRSRTRVVLGLQVDTLDLSIYPRDTDTLSGTPLLTAAAGGVLDRARLVLERCFFAADGSAVGTVHLFSGYFSDITLGRTEIKVGVKSDLEALAIQLPRNLYQAGCVHTLFDAGCGLNREAWNVAGTVAAGATAFRLPCSLAQAAGWFNRGQLRFVSGNLLDVTRTIKAYTPGVVHLYLPLPAVPAAGDVFIALPGCDKRQATCSGKFNNLPGFRGCPYIPEPETAV